MTDGPLWLFASIGWGIVLVVLAYKSGWIDKLARHFTTPPPPRASERSGHHCNVVRAPLPRRSPPCDLYGYPGGEDGAA